MAQLAPFTREPYAPVERTSAELSPVRPAPEKDIPLAPLTGLLPTPGTELAPLATEPDAAALAPEPERPDLVADTRQASRDYQQLGRAKNAVNAALINADVAIANEPDEKKRAKLIADRQQLGQTQALAAQSQQAAGEAVDMNLAKAGEELAVKQADATLSAMEETDAAITEGQAKQDRRLQEQAASLEAAKVEQEESRARYTATLERGPRAAAVGSTFADIISETFSASLEQRVPNYAAATAAAWKRDRELFAEDIQRAAGAVATSGDRVRDVGAERDTILAEEATAQASVIDAVTRKAELAVQRARNPLEKAQAAAVYKGMQEQQEMARANAAQARLDARRKADKHRLDMQLGEAKVAKLGADVAKTEAEAAKLARRGRGRRKSRALVERQLAALPPKDRGQVEKRGIRDIAGNFLQNSDGTFVLAKSEKVSTDLAKSGAAMQSVNDSLMRLESLRNEYGHEFTVGNSKAVQDMESTMESLKLKLKDVFQLGILSETDMEMLGKITGGSASGWFNKTPTWHAMRERVEKSYARELRSLTSFKGDIRLERVEPIRREKPDTYKRRYSHAYSPKTGTASVESRFANVKNEQTALAEKFGGVDDADYIIQAAQTVNEYVSTTHPNVVDGIEEDIEEAEKSGDTEAVARLEGALKRENAFAHRMRIERTRLRRQQGEGPARARKMAKESKMAEEARPSEKAKPSAVMRPRFGG